MYQIDFKKPERVYFVGIGGISMSGLAEILMEEGFLVSGSDTHESELTKHLESRGARIFYGQKAENITDDTDVVVYTAAIHPDNPEYQAAVKKNLPMLSRAALLGQMMKNYGESIAVSGTHGKTTTTSMLAEVLMKADKNPTISVGGILKSIGGNIRVGGSELFLTEACEYTNSFLSFFPTVEIILNIEEDHLDFFKDIEDIRNSFRMFAGKLPKDGALIINSSIERRQEITDDIECRVITVGTCPEDDYRAADIRYDELARPEYTLIRRGKADVRIKLGVTGEHNVYNSLAVIACAELLGVSLENTLEALRDFGGTKRRFEKKGVCRGITVIDDYAHHPREIAVTLQAAKNYPHRRLWCAFQPHTYTRTKAFLDEFAEALSLADEVILADIYAARETDTLGVSSADIAERIAAKGVRAHYLPTFDEIEKFILENCNEGDLLITMGAGDIVTVGENLLK